MSPGKHPSPVLLFLVAKLIGHINYWFQYGLPGVFLNGALHWFAYDNKTTYNFISGQPRVLLSFDLSREEFKEIPKPDDSRYHDSYATLGIFEDNLCISCEDVLSRSGKQIIDRPIFVQSFVSPYVNCDRPSHAGSAKLALFYILCIAAERECHQMRVFERRKKYQYDEEISRMREVYWREGGQNEKSYLREGGETKRKRQRRDVNRMSKEK
ncbi:F-box protein-like protein [Tanacetum coccineum]